MGRKSSRFMADTVAAAVTVLRSGAPEAHTEWNRSGCERADLTRHLWEIDPACIVCGLDTFHSTYKGAATGVLFHIVPPSLVPGMGTVRGGYIGGGIGLACRACADATGLYVKAGGEWTDAVLNALDLDRVPTAWPVLSRVYRIPTEDARALAFIARVSATHAEDARVARQERGLPF